MRRIFPCYPTHVPSLKMTELAGKRILLGLTGGIAAYKAAELARLFVKSGADVQVVMTQAACGFVTPATMQALSGRPVFTDMWDSRVPNNMGHTALSRARDLIVVAPASANFMARLAHGLADDLLSTLCLARRCALAVAPAMNVEMWNHPATQRTAAQLGADRAWLEERRARLALSSKALDAAFERLRK